MQPHSRAEKPRPCPTGFTRGQAKHQFSITVAPTLTPTLERLCSRKSSCESINCLYDPGQKNMTSQPYLEHWWSKLSWRRLVQIGADLHRSMEHAELCNSQRRTKLKYLARFMRDHLPDVLTRLWGKRNPSRILPRNQFSVQSYCFVAKSMPVGVQIWSERPHNDKSDLFLDWHTLRSNDQTPILSCLKVPPRSLL